MRRLLLLLLAVLLPCQFAWAAAAAYCGHEGPDAPWHIGHHVHVHDAGKTVAKGGQQEDAKPGTLDNDCSFCHAALQPVAYPSLTIAMAVSHGDAIAVPPKAAFTSLVPRAPDRPQWRRFA